MTYTGRTGPRSTSAAVALICIIATLYLEEAESSPIISRPITSLMNEFNCYNDGKQLRLAKTCLVCRCNDATGSCKYRRLQCAYDQFKSMYDRMGCIAKRGSGCCPKMHCPSSSAYKKMIAKNSDMSAFTCFTDGKRAKLADKSCLICRCKADTGKCRYRRLECSYNLNKEKFERLGCKPLYNDSECCPKVQCPQSAIFGQLEIKTQEINTGDDGTSNVDSSSPAPSFGTGARSVDVGLSNPVVQQVQNNFDDEYSGSGLSQIGSTVDYHHEDSSSGTMTGDMQQDYTNSGTGASVQDMNLTGPGNVGQGLSGDGGNDYYPGATGFSVGHMGQDYGTSGNNYDYSGATGLSGTGSDVSAGMEQTLTGISIIGSQNHVDNERVNDVNQVEEQVPIIATENVVTEMNMENSHDQSAANEVFEPIGENPVSNTQEPTIITIETTTIPEISNDEVPQEISTAVIEDNVMIQNVPNSTSQPPIPVADIQEQSETSALPNDNEHSIKEQRKTLIELLSKLVKHFDIDNNKSETQSNDEETSVIDTAATEQSIEGTVDNTETAAEPAIDGQVNAESSDGITEVAGMMEETTTMLPEFNTETAEIENLAGTETAFVEEANPMMPEIQTDVVANTNDEESKNAGLETTMVFEETTTMMNTDMMVDVTEPNIIVTEEQQLEITEAPSVQPEEHVQQELAHTEAPAQETNNDEGLSDQLYNILIDFARLIRLGGQEDTPKVNETPDIKVELLNFLNEVDRTVASHVPSAANNNDQNIDKSEVSTVVTATESDQPINNEEQQVASSPDQLGMHEIAGPEYTGAFPFEGAEIVNPEIMQTDDKKSETESIQQTAEITQALNETSESLIKANVPLLCKSTGDGFYVTDGLCYTCECNTPECLIKRIECMWHKNEQDLTKHNCKATYKKGQCCPEVSCWNDLVILEENEEVRKQLAGVKIDDQKS